MNAITSQTTSVAIEEAVEPALRRWMGNVLPEVRTRRRVGSPYPAPGVGWTMTLRRTNIQGVPPPDNTAMMRLGRAIVFVLAPSVAAGAMLLGAAIALARFAG